jgi:hypothetical protein
VRLRVQLVHCQVCPYQVLVVEHEGIAALAVLVMFAEHMKGSFLPSKRVATSIDKITGQPDRIERGTHLTFRSASLSFLRCENLDGETPRALCHLAPKNSSASFERHFNRAIVV